MTLMSASQPADDRLALEFEHKQLLEMWKTTTDGYYKLANISFVLNGILLAAMPFVHSQAAGPVKALGALALSTIGVIYNVGALSSYFGSLKISAFLSRRQEALEERLGLELHKFRTPSYLTFFGIFGVLTTIFYVAFCLIWVRFYLIV